MDRNGANEVLRLLKGYYPGKYPDNMSDDKAKFVVDDIEESFKRYDSHVIVRAYKEWHLHFSNAPSIADIKGMLSAADKKPDPSPTKWVNYFEDCEGYGYAMNSKTHEYECIWKPHWNKERDYVFPKNMTATDLDGVVTEYREGERVHLPAVSKAETLRRFGIGG